MRLEEIFFFKIILEAHNIKKLIVLTLHENKGSHYLRLSKEKYREDTIKI